MEKRYQGLRQRQRWADQLFSHLRRRRRAAGACYRRAEISGRRAYRRRSDGRRGRTGGGQALCGVLPDAWACVPGFLPVPGRQRGLVRRGNSPYGGFARGRHLLAHFCPCGDIH